VPPERVELVFAGAGEEDRLRGAVQRLRQRVQAPSIEARTETDETVHPT